MAILGVFTRKPSNYDRLAQIGGNAGRKNENVQPVAIARKAVALVTAQGRAKRLRVVSGQMTAIQRMKRSKKRHDYKKSRAQSTHRQQQQATPSSSALPNEGDTHDNNHEAAEEAEEAMDISMHSAPGEEPAPVFKGIELPRQLPRPPLPEVSNELLAAIDPSLQGIPVAFITEIVQEAGPGMFQALKNTEIVSKGFTPSSDAQIPKRVDVRVRGRFGPHPTHAIAAVTRVQVPSGHIKTTVQLSPVHSIMSTLFLPRWNMPHPQEDLDAEEFSGIDEKGPFVQYSVPVVAMRVPNLSLFHLLMAYLYNPDENRLLNSLLGFSIIPDSPPPSEPTQLPTPPPSADNSPANSQSDSEYDVSHVISAAAQLVSQYSSNPYGLLRKAESVRNLWRTAVMLGVPETGLWSAIDMSWAVITRALGIVSGSGALPVRLL